MTSPLSNNTTDSKKVLILDWVWWNGKGNRKPRLQKECKNDMIEVESPEIPSFENPNYDIQLDFLIKNYKDWIDTTTIIVAHSWGWILAKWFLAESKKKIAHLIEVAPTSSIYDRKERREKQADKKEKSQERYSHEKKNKWFEQYISQHTVLISDFDTQLDTDAIFTQQAYKGKYPTSVFIVLPGRWHFSTRNGNVTELPELLDLIKNTIPSQSHDNNIIYLGSIKGSNLILKKEKQEQLMMKHEHSQDGFIHLVGCIVKDSEGRRYVHHEAQSNEFYLPGGKIDKGETILQWAVRELQEELAIEVKEFEEIGSFKRIHNGIKLILHIVEITSYTGTPLNNDSHKYDHYRAKIIDSDNSLGFAVKIDGTITDDEFDIAHSFLDIYNSKANLAFLQSSNDDPFEEYDDSLINPSWLYHQYYDSDQKKYFFSEKYIEVYDKR